MLREDIAKLERVQEQTREAPQSPSRELELYRLDINLRRLKAKREQSVADVEELLLGFFRQNGSARVSVNGVIHETNPVVTGSAVQNVWNVRGEIQRLAALKVDCDGYVE